MERSRIIEALDVLADCDEGEIVDALLARGYTPAEAHRLALFVPAAFCEPVLQHYGVRRASQTIQVPLDDGRLVGAQLAWQPEYVAAMSLLGAHRDGPPLFDNQLFVKIVGRTAELDVLDQMLKAGEDTRGAVVATVAVDSAAAPYVVRTPPLRSGIKLRPGSKASGRSAPS